MYYRWFLVSVGKEKKFIKDLFYFTPICGNIRHEVNLHGVWYDYKKQKNSVE